MNITQHISNNDSYLRDIKKVKSIILHHTWSSAKDSNVLKYLNKKNFVSCHYMVTTRWTVYQMVDDNRVAYHAGVSSYKWLPRVNQSLNECTLGIEVNSNWKRFNDKQRKACKELIQHLKNKYKIENKYILTHALIAPWRKTDIAPVFYEKEFWTWKNYQDQFTEKMWIKEKMYRKILKNLNSKIWNITKDRKLKQLLNMTNRYLRKG